MFYYNMTETIIYISDILGLYNIFIRSFRPHTYCLKTSLVRTHSNSLEPTQDWPEPEKITSG